MEKNPDDFCSICKKDIDEDFYKILSIFEEAPERKIICDGCFNVVCPECWAVESQLNDVNHDVCLKCDSRCGAENSFKHRIIKAGFKDVRGDI